MYNGPNEFPKIYNPRIQANIICHKSRADKKSFEVSYLGSVEKPDEAIISP